MNLLSWCTYFHWRQKVPGCKKVQVGNDQEKAQAERHSHSKNRGGKNKLTIRYVNHENISKS